MAVVYATAADVAAFMGITEGELPSNIAKLITDAQDLIDYITFNRLELYIVDDVIDDEDLVDPVKYATCAQIEYWINTSDASDITGAPISSYALGTLKVQFGGASGGTGSIGGSGLVAPRVNRYLSHTGLMYRGIYDSSGLRVNDMSRTFFDKYRRW
jgi:hypothetical protein